MKYLTLILLIFLLSCEDSATLQPNIQSNVVYQIAVNSQEDLNNIDFNQIDTIKGYVDIRNTSITDLSFLSNICITGRIDIFGNDSLTSLNGIENVNCVTVLVVEQNRSLRNVQALEGLEISEHLKLKNNGLEVVEPINSLNKIRNQIFISEPKLKDYRMLRNIEEVNSLILGGSLAENLDDLENLKTVNTEIRITGNQNLIDYCGIKNALSNSNQIIFETLGNQINPTVSEIVGDCN